MKLVLNEHGDPSRICLVSFRAFRGPLWPKPVNLGDRRGRSKTSEPSLAIIMGLGRTLWVSLDLDYIKQ